MAGWAKENLPRGYPMDKAMGINWMGQTNVLFSRCEKFIVRPLEALWVFPVKPRLHKVPRRSYKSYCAVVLGLCLAHFLVLGQCLTFVELKWRLYRAIMASSFFWPFWTQSPYSIFTTCHVAVMLEHWTRLCSLNATLTVTTWDQ